MNLWLTMVAAGLLTFAIRLSFIGFWGRFMIPDWLQRALRYVPPAVLSAIIFPEVLISGGELNLSLANPRLVAGIVAVIVAWRSKNIVWTILAGMLSLWAFQLWLH